MKIEVRGSFKEGGKWVPLYEMSNFLAEDKAVCVKFNVLSFISFLQGCTEVLHPSIPACYHGSVQGH